MNQQKVEILIAEDEKLLPIQLEEELREYFAPLDSDPTFKIITTPAEAIELFEGDTSFDIVFVDHSLERGAIYTGANIYDALLRQESLPIIFGISAYPQHYLGDNDHYMGKREADIEGFIKKALDPIYNTEG